MSEREGYVPPEARQEAEAEKKPEKAELRPETIDNIRHGPPETTEKPASANQPEAVGESNSYINPATGRVTTHEHEDYRRPESLTEVEPGFMGKASFSDDPNVNPANDQTADSDAKDEWGEDMPSDMVVRETASLAKMAVKESTNLVKKAWSIMDAATEKTRPGEYLSTQAIQSIQGQQL
jgi:hypothetical protein